MPRGEGRHGEMTALVWVLVVAIVVLGAFVAAGLVLGSRALRQLQSSKIDAKDRQDQVDDAKAKVAAAGFKFNYLIDSQPNSAAANTVTRQDPAAGQSALPGAAINVYVSAGGTTTGG